MEFSRDRTPQERPILRDRADRIGQIILELDNDVILPSCPEGASYIAQRRVLDQRNELLDTLRAAL
ncbi:hypothetical protein KC973_00670 [Candidatus Saccharibacteria bacterium]|nr:hypothetical protein [Candidatus Saccharibacteria bacterium]